jgi:glycosyltransferase involved in cell wall biosynthesis
MSDSINKREMGVSVVICTYNAAEHLAAVLDALLAQDETENINWEILIVDNNSIDSTIKLINLYQKNHKSNLIRLTVERQQGQSYARMTGFRESMYEFISFVDQDNIVEGFWISKVFHTMKANERAGACGGRTNGVLETEPSEWCRHLLYSLAVGSQFQCSGKSPSDVDCLWGAGMTVRAAALEQIIRCGFSFCGSGRSGKALMAGDDTELCFALRLCNWNLLYDDDLLLKHLIPAGRLQWHYFRRLYRGFGMSDVPLAPYRQQLGHPRVLTTDSWVREVGRLIWQLAGWKNWYGWYCRLAGKEGSYSVLRIEKLLGSLSMLLRLRGGYGDMCARVREFSARCRMSC